ncbi:MAG TPA: 3-oxoacyl-[acyl-carrier-protein] synthase III C-terminal domain-containing protein, partial [Candidatus Kapabacteria bacterium]
QRDDRGKSNIIAAALFADGGAACLVCGNDVPKQAGSFSNPSIVRSLSTIYPDTLDVMGWRITSEGFKIVLSRDIPTIVTSLVRNNIEELVTEQGIEIKDIKHYAAHPGGAKVMDAYQSALALDGELHHSLDVLREYGNMSSATVFFILERLLAETKYEREAYGLISALGPGFSSELVLIQWP